MYSCNYYNSYALLCAHFSSFMSAAKAIRAVQFHHSRKMKWHLVEYKLQMSGDFTDTADTALRSVSQPKCSSSPSVLSSTKTGDHLVSAVDSTNQHLYS